MGVIVAIRFVSIDGEPPVLQCRWADPVCDASGAIVGFSKPSEFVTVPTVEKSNYKDEHQCRT
jgi:hypothetical protein